MALIDGAKEPIRIIIEAHDWTLDSEREHAWEAIRTTLTVHDPISWRHEPLGLDDIANRQPTNHDIEYLIRRVKVLQEALDKSRDEVRAQYTRYEESKSKWRKKYLPTPIPEVW